MPYQKVERYYNIREFMKKSKRGGARAGSGRKKTDNISLCIRISKDAAEYIKLKSKEENVSLGSWITSKLGL